MPAPDPASTKHSVVQPVAALDTGRYFHNSGVRFTLTTGMAGHTIRYRFFATGVFRPRRCIDEILYLTKKIILKSNNNWPLL